MATFDVSGLENQRKDLETTRQKLIAARDGTWEEGERRLLEMDIEDTERHIKNLKNQIEQGRELFAPFSGTVIGVFAQSGMMVGRSAPLFELSDMELGFIIKHVIPEDKAKYFNTAKVEIIGTIHKIKGKIISRSPAPGGIEITIELEPVKKFVRLRHVPFSSVKACMDAVGQIAADGTFEGGAADFLDGVAFGPDELYLTVGTYSDVAPWLSDYTGQQVYYRSVREFREDFLTIRDYLWRWDTDWFWCSRPFGLQNPTLRRLWPRRYRRSDVYRKLVAFDRRYGLTDQMDRSRHSAPKEAVIQDVEIPLERCADFVDFFFREIGMSPVWMCPLRLRSTKPWPLYPLEPGRVHVNFGFWGTVPLPPGRSDGYRNRLVEDAVGRLDGHKSLYSTAYYSRDEFWRRYNGPAYAELKRTYDPEGRLLDLYDKCVRPR
jgi:hypothetical protein